MKKELNVRLKLWAVTGTILLGFIAVFIFSSAGVKQTANQGPGSADSIIYYQNMKGPLLGYATGSGVKLIKQNGLYFKDLNKDGKLDKYEDWRLPLDQRIKDLVSKLSIEQLSGLMLYSLHQAIPGKVLVATYSGKPFPESRAEPSDLSDQQKLFLQKDNIRHVLITAVSSPSDAALWNNKAQAFVEGLGMGIPVNTSSDPRHSVDVGAEYTAGAGGEISQWPDPLGLAATFDPGLVENFGHIAAQEYRAMGISTALSPQIDLGTEPRWVRINGTFGEDPQLSTDMARAYVDGFQTSYGKDEIAGGWGYGSVNAMIKHWPGGGPEEGGRDAHYAYGKYAVYPGNNFDEHLLPFIQGGMRLNHKTRTASALMPYYTVSYGIDTKNGQNAGNSYSSYLIGDQLRDKYGFNGVVCTDWQVTADEGKGPDDFKGKSWGMETASVIDRHIKAINAGVDQFGGNNDAAPVIASYNRLVMSEGELTARARFELSASRLLRNIMQLGLFENPYLKIKKTIETVGNPAFMTAGYLAQLKSIVLLKNKGNVLPIKEGSVVYIPKSYSSARKDFFNKNIPEKYSDPVQADLLAKFFKVTDDPNKADFALVFVSGPVTGTGYDRNDLRLGGNGYLPISLQYGTYKAIYAREHSLAAGDPAEPGILNRSYKDKSVTASNLVDIDIIKKTRSLMNGKPVIVSISLSKPAILAEFEENADAIIVSFGVKNQAVLAIVSGVEPQGLLPFQLPANMKTVELQYEDVPHDMICYKDSEGRLYDFGFGLNWKGVIHDARTDKYLNQISRPKVHIVDGRLSLSCNTSDTQIYFSLNGITPAFNEKYLYKSSVPLIGHGVLMTMAKKQGVNNSSLVTMRY